MEEMVTDDDMLSKLRDTYRKKKVLVTGHTGFKGSWLITWLNMLGADICGYALPAAPHSLFTNLDHNQLCKSVMGDVKDQCLLEKTVLEFQPDYIFHLAAQPLVRLSYKIPIETFSVNAIGTANLLEAVRQLEKQCVVVVVTTDKVYDNKEWIYPYRENEALGGYDPYSASKACAEIITNSYRNSFFNSSVQQSNQKYIASARAGNVIGGGDWAEDRLIPDVVRALKKGTPILIRHPNSVRPWQHVLEPLAGYLQLAAIMTENPQQFCQAWNFGPFVEDQLKVEDVVKLAIDAWGGGHYQIQLDSTELHEAKLLRLDISKSLTDLKWRPRWNAKKAIQATINFYKNGTADVHEGMIREINEYIGKEYL